MIKLISYFSEVKQKIRHIFLNSVRIIFYFKISSYKQIRKNGLQKFKKITHVNLK